MRWTRLTPAAGGPDPTRAAAPGGASPAGPARRARRRTRAARTTRAARRGSAWDHPRAIHRATHEARGAAQAEERTAGAERTRTGPGMPADRGHRPMSPKRLATPAATPLRARPIMKSTPTLRIAVDDDVAPRRSMKGLGSEVLLEVREARAAAAPPPRPRGQETAAPPRAPRAAPGPGPPRVGRPLGGRIPGGPDQAWESEEAREEREQGPVGREARRAAEGRDPEGARERLHPRSQEDPPHPSPTVGLRREEEGQKGDEERGGPRPEGLEQADGVREGQPEGHEEDEGP